MEHCPSPWTPGTHLPCGERRGGQGGVLGRPAPTATADTAASLLGSRPDPGNPQIPSALQAGDSRGSLIRAGGGRVRPQCGGGGGGGGGGGQGQAGLC